MKAKLILENGKEFEVEVDEKQLKTKTKRTGYERVEKGKYYYYLGNFFDYDKVVAKDCLGDNLRYERGNYYTDRDLVENIVRATRLEFQLRRFSAEHRDEDINWDDYEQLKHCITYDYYSGFVSIDDNFGERKQGTIYFDSVEHCQMAIDEFKDELIWYFTEYKDSIPYTSDDICFDGYEDEIEDEMD